MDKDLAAVYGGNTSKDSPTIDSDETLAEEIEECRKKGQDYLSKWYEEAMTCYKFCTQDQYDRRELDALEAQKRPPVVFNFIGKYVNSIRGQEAANRQETAYLPRTVMDGDPEGAEMMTVAAKWARDQCNAENEESDAFADTIICGLGVTCTEMSYEEDPMGKILITRRSVFDISYDPSACKRGLTDAQWVQCRYPMSEEEIKLRWPETSQNIEIDLEEGGFRQLDSQRGYRAPPGMGYKLQNNYGSEDQYVDKLEVIHHVYYKLAKYHQFIDNSGAGTIAQLSDEEFQLAQSRAKELGMPLPQSVGFLKKVWYHAWYCGGTILESGKVRTQAGCVYNFITGERDQSTGYWHGIVASLIDPQKYVNTLVGQIWQIIRTSAKGGLIAEEDVTSNVHKFEQNWAQGGAITWVNPGKLDKVQQKPQPQMPQAANELMRFSIEAMTGISGINTELIGQTNRNQPGVVEDLRTKASLIVLAPWFDALNLYRKNQGRVLADFINEYIPDGRMIRIVGSGLRQAIPFRKVADTMEYDIVVDEAATSRDVKERAYLSLTTMVPMALQMGLPVPPDVIDYAPIPSSLATKWKQMIEEQQKQPKQPPMQMQIEQMKAQAQMALQQQKTQSEMQIEQYKQQVEVMRQQMEIDTQSKIESAQAQSQQAIAMMELEVKKQEAQIQLIVDLFKTKIETQADLQIEAFKAQAQKEMQLADSMMNQAIQQDQTRAN